MPNAKKATGAENDVLHELEEARVQKKLIDCLVRACGFAYDDTPEHLICDYKGVTISVPKSEIDADLVYKSLSVFVGQTITVVIREVNREIGSVIASRAEAQNIVKATLLPALIEEHRSYKATVVNVMKHGVYVSIKGITGLLTNPDFASDTTRAFEILHVGDVVEVKYRHTTKKGTIHFTAVNKYSAPNALKADAVREGMTALGVVRKTVQKGTSLNYIVNIANGVDVYAASETDAPITTDDQVIVQVKHIRRKEVDGEARVFVYGTVKGVLGCQVGGNS